MSLPRVRPFLIAACLAAAATTASAEIVNPVTYDFTQTGFNGGATVTGSFTAIDNNSNNYISLTDGDTITAFTATFSGNAVVGSFTMDLANLQVLAWYVLLDPLLGNAGNEGIFWQGGSYLWATGNGIGAQCDGLGSCGGVSNGEWNDLTIGFAEVTAAAVPPATSEVPLPASGLLLVAGLGGLAAARRKRTG